MFLSVSMHYIYKQSILLSTYESIDEGGSGEGEGSLEDSIPGVPGTDYPIYADIPETGFTCEDKVSNPYPNLLHENDALLLARNFFLTVFIT